MPSVRFALALAIGSVLSSCAAVPGPASDGLRIATWNVEHLAEADGTGCRPRTGPEYDALRDYVIALDADVVAFQEVESVKAAERVFDPAVYEIVMEARPGSNRQSACRGRDGLFIRSQKVGFAVRRDLDIERHDDLTGLQLGDPDLRSGVDIRVTPPGGRPLRLLAVHLKSGCASGSDTEACPVLFSQVPLVEAWIDARADEPVDSVVLGDFNRRLATANDPVWADWDDGEPAGADLIEASGGRAATCNPRYAAFIDFILLDARAAARQEAFEEVGYAGPPLSDHCAVVVTLAP